MRHLSTRAALAAALLGGACAARAADAPAPAPKPLRVVATIFPAWDWAREVLGADAPEPPPQGFTAISRTAGGPGRECVRTAAPRRRAPAPAARPRSGSGYPLTYLTASVAATAPSAVAVTSWRRDFVRLSPATKTPGAPVRQSSPATT